MKTELAVLISSRIILSNDSHNSKITLVYLNTNYDH